MNVATNLQDSVVAKSESKTADDGSISTVRARVEPFTLEISQLVDELETHPVYGNDYFKLLCNTPWTKEAYALHRANFFYRTELTVKAIAQVCARSAEENDTRTLILFSYILNEECGNGEFKHCHAVLMERCHNLFGSTVFGLEPLPVISASSSPLIIEATNRYRQRIRELCSGSYQRMLGVAVALESHADKMLTNCRTAFRMYADKFERSQFVNDVEVYFNAHLNEGVEQRHAADARDCARRNCRNAEDLAEIAYGARETLKVQLVMWQELHEVAAALVGPRRT